MDPHSRGTNYKIQAAEMRCFWASPTEIMLVVTNEEVRNNIRHAIGSYKDFITTVSKPKLRWYGHIQRSTGLAKMILQRTVQGGRRKGRQKKRWGDKMSEWTSIKLGETLRKSENGEEWRKVVTRSSLLSSGHLD